MGIYNRMSPEQLGMKKESTNFQVTTADDEMLKALTDDEEVMSELIARLDGDEVLAQNLVAMLVKTINSKLPIIIGK